MYIKNRLGLIESTETMLAQTERLNQITNNLANVDTPGYKKDEVTFWEMLYTTSQHRQRVGKALKVVTDHQEGPLKNTGNQLDFAIDGNGFFKLQTPQGIRYSKAGNFQLNNEGQLVNPDGYLVLGDGGPVVISGNQVAVDGSGRILVDGTEAGRLDIASFTSPADLEKEGNNLFRLKEGAGEEGPAENFTVKQGFLEVSNVTVVSEMTAMIDLQRAYEAQQSVIRTFDELDDRAINTVGKLNI